MDYTPTNSVWELTYACNMRCKHCGSSCGTKYPDELSLEECMQLCDDLAELGMKVVTLSGGEPFMHPHWDKIARRLTDNGVTTNVISNGWFIDQQLITRAKAAGIVNIGVSLDGLKETHEFIRMPGSFDRVLHALDVMNSNNMPTVVCTSVNKMNFSELPELKNILYEKKVQRWQFQIASPMGNLLEHPELLCEMEEADKLIDFTFDVMQEKKIFIDLADDIGYFNIKENEIRKQSFNVERPLTMWTGCQAGKCVMGIRANGDISGCLSIRDENFIEGNIREIPLKEIWTRDKAFSWNRNLTKEKMTGFCGKCQYGNYCLGGCTGLKLTFSGSIYDNKYCSFRLAVEKEEEKINKITVIGKLIEMARKSISDEDYQIAELLLSRAFILDPLNVEIIDLLGFVHYFLENYKECQKYNVMSLQMNPQNAYAHKGLGLALAAMGDTEEGINHLKKAIQLADKNFTDPYFDLAVVLDQNGRTGEALEILESGRRISDAFIERSDSFFKQLKNKILSAEKAG